MTPADPPECIKVGALARYAGLTVRTLHHYEAIGLLLPQARTPSGHRLYGVEEVRRLHQITSLRQLGLSLDEIARALDDPVLTFETILDTQIERLRNRIRAEEELCARLESLRDRLAADGEGVGLAELAESIGRTVRVESYFTEEQRSYMESRAREVGPARMESAASEWGDLFAAFASALERGKPPDHPDVIALARRAAALVEEFTGADPTIRASLAKMYETEGPDRVLGQRGMAPAPGVWEYMRAATEALRSTE